MAEITVLKVSSKSVPNKVASAIVGMTKEGKKVELQAIGNGALGQINKALAIANKFVEKEDYEFWQKNKFVDLQIDGEDRTGMRVLVKTFPKE